MDADHLELVVSTSTQIITVPLCDPVWLGSALDVDVRLPELAPRHVVVERSCEGAIVRTVSPQPPHVTCAGRRSPSVALTLDGPAVELAGASLRLSALAQTPPPRPESRTWVESVVDTQRLTAVRELGDETAARVFQALHSLGSLGKHGATPSALLSPAAQVLLESTRSSQAGILWRPDPAGPWSRALRSRGRVADEVQLDPSLVDRVATSCTTLVTSGDDGPRAYLPLRAPSADRPSGAIYLGRPRGEPAFTSFDVELATLIGRNLVIMLDRVRALKLLRARTEDLEASHERQSTILDAISEGIVVIRKDGGIDLVNQVARSLFESREPRHESTVVRTFSIADLVETAFGGVSSLRRDVTAPEGKTYEVSASPVVTMSDRGVRDAVVVLRDVTEERERERALHDSERLRALGEAMATVAHELNNPLTAVVGFSMLLEGRAPDGLREHCRRISEQAERCLTIVRSVLDVSRAGRRASETTFDVMELARRATEPFRLELERSSIELRFEGAACFVHGDPQRIVQVFVNLVRNAMEALVEGACPSRLITVSADPGEGRARVCVGDTGPGIAPALRQRLFKPFATTRGNGTGLGLSVCATIVREHGGALTCQSEAGRTQFTFDLALAPSTVAPPPRRATTRSAARPRTVLVADDEEPVRSVLRDHLEAEGHVVELQSDGTAALRRLLEGPTFDVVLLDLHMPGVTGTEILERLAATGSPLLARCYVMTGEVDDAIVEPAQRLAAGLLRKPFTLSDLRRTLRWSPTGAA